MAFEGEVVGDRTYPDGTPRKLLDVSRIKGLGFSQKVGLKEGAERDHEWNLGEEG